MDKKGLWIGDRVDGRCARAKEVKALAEGREIHLVGGIVGKALVDGKDRLVDWPFANGGSYYVDEKGHVYHASVTEGSPAWYDYKTYKSRIRFLQEVEAQKEMEKDAAFWAHVALRGPAKWITPRDTWSEERRVQNGNSK